MSKVTKESICVLLEFIAKPSSKNVKGIDSYLENCGKDIIAKFLDDTANYFVNNDDPYKRLEVYFTRPVDVTAEEVNGLCKKIDDYLKELNAENKSIKVHRFWPLDTDKRDVLPGVKVKCSLIKSDSNVVRESSKEITKSKVEDFDIKF